jgi:hypothetical protein
MRRAVWYLTATVLAVVASALVAAPASAATAIEYGLIAALIAVA